MYGWCLPNNCCRFVTEVLRTAPVEAPPFSEVGNTEGCISHFGLLWLLPDALETIAVFCVLLRRMKGVWVISVSAAYMMGFSPSPHRVSALLLPS